MQAFLKCEYTGRPCWNVELLKDYAADVTRQEQQHAEDFPEVVVEPGKIECEKAIVNQFGNGEVCTSNILLPFVTYLGEVTTMPAQPTDVHSIPGFLFYKPDGGMFHQMYLKRHGGEDTEPS